MILISNYYKLLRNVLFGMLFRGRNNNWRSLETGSIQKKPMEINATWDKNIYLKNAKLPGLKMLKNP